MSDSVAKKVSNQKFTKQITHSQFKRHEMKKVNFDSPTWCIFANKFIWGLDKCGYKCSVCGMVCSRPHIAFAKRTVCNPQYKPEALVTTVNVDKGNRSDEIFTIHFPMGAKKSMIMDPSQQLKVALDKICVARGITLDEFYPQDKYGQIVALSKKLGDIEGREITFTKKDQTINMKQIPPLIEDLEREELTRNSKSSDSDKSKAAKIKLSKGSDSRNSQNNKSVKSSGITTPPNEKVASKTSDSKTSDISRNNDEPPSSPKEKVVETVERVPDSYALDTELGNGAFSVVYSAKHKRTGQIVAIKVLEKYADADSQKKKLTREISIHKDLSHPHIIKFLQLDEDDDHFYVVMELVTGGELFEQVCVQRYYYEKEAAPLICQVLQGILYLHDRGIAHRDIKPENLLFSDKSMTTLKIADFGESKTFVDNQLQTYCGTSDYMAPEIVKGLNYGREVDMWALGVTTFILLGGYAPFDGDNDTEVFTAILTLDYKYISPEWDHVGPVGKDFIDSLLKLDASKRMTARQALLHPFIVNNVAAELRKIPDVNLGDHDFAHDPKQACLNVIQTFLQIVKVRLDGGIKPEHAKEDQLIQGELNSMLRVVALGGNSARDLTDYEKLVLETTWERLQQVRPYIYV